MYAIDYEDFGTPQPVNGAGAVTVEIDGHAVSVPEGTSVMRAAALAGVKVPKLCATDTLQAPRGRRAVAGCRRRAPPTPSGRSAPGGCAWWRAKVARAPPPRAPPPW